MKKIAHIINPVSVDVSSDLFVAQPITFETMHRAKQYAVGQVEVELYSAQFSEDRSFIPNYFIKTHDLERSILDIGTFQEQRKLPLMKDILERLFNASDADYLIYTNVDIALMPYFYVAVNKIIETGYDAFVINRRTISEQYSSIDELYLMFSQVGEKHPGYDCFVFKRSLYPKFKLSTTCIGAAWIGRVLIINLICHSENFKVFEDLHLTFHFGDDRSWKVPIYQDYDMYNEEKLHKILLEYKAKGLFRGKPLVAQFLQYIENSKQTLNKRKSKYVKSLLIKTKKYLKMTLKLK